MSTVIGKTRGNRVYLRKFDYDDARRRHAAGETITEIARDYEVSWARVAQIVRPEVGARVAARAATQRWPCPDCGKPATKKGSRCRACWNRYQATTVRETELFCFKCGIWYPDDYFPRNRAEAMRRERHGLCRYCQTAAKRAYRERNKAPCSHGCGRLVDARNRRNNTKPLECAPCSRARLNGRPVPA